MSDDQLLTAIQAITNGAPNVAEVIGWAQGLVEAGRKAEAVQVYKVWLGFNRDHPQAYVALFNCSGLQSDLGDLFAAIGSLNRAIEQNPDFHPAHINLGGLLERAGLADQALDQWKEVITRTPAITGTLIEHKLTAYKQIGRVLLDQQRSAEAEVFLHQALQIVPEQRDVLEQYVALRMAQCKWPVIAPWEGMSRETLMIGVSPLSMCAYTDDPILQLATAKRYVQKSFDHLLTQVVREDGWPPIDLTGRRLRVGYVSSDLRDHAVGYLMAEMFELHDRGKVEVFAYNCGPNAAGALTLRVQAAVEHWVDIEGLSDEAATQRVVDDGIDILVDVNGLTRFARTGVFARRPAPIQVNWLGFPGSMGSDYHHYIIADDWIIPPAHESWFSETVLRLPCYQPNDRKRQVLSPPPSRADVGLPDDAFVFCCFNGAQKFTRFTVDRWVEILKGAPGSVLWLLEGAADTNQRLRDYFAAASVAPERLVFAPKQANAAHLSRYPLADLFLDSAPYGAHTTASDALWMGVPVLTLTGRAFASRVCGSLVRAAGLPDMICERAEDYVARAVALAADPAAVAALKARLEASRATCDLFNMEKLVSALEALYVGMVADQQAGRLPRPDLRNLDLYQSIAIETDHEAVEMRAVEDYEGHYLAALRRRNRLRAVHPDGILWPGEPPSS